MNIDDIKSRLKNIIRVPLTNTEYYSENSRNSLVNIDIVCESTGSDEYDVYKDNFIGLNNIRYTVRQSNSSINEHITKINNYLSDNEPHIIKFYKINRTNNYLSKSNCINDSMFHSDRNNLEVSFDENANYNNKKLEIINDLLKEINIRIKNNNEELSKELYKLVDPYVKILYEFYKLKIDVNNLTLFLKDCIESDSIQKILILNKILQNVIKRERVRNIKSYIMSLRNLKNIQSCIQKLLCDKEYIEAIDIIEDTLSKINSNNKDNNDEITINYKYIKSLSNLSVRLCEFNNVIEKLSLEDFISIVLKWLKSNVNVTYEDIEANLDNISDLFITFINNVSKDSTQDVLLSEFHKVSYFYSEYYKKNCNTSVEEVSSTYTNVSLIYPIIILLRKQRINFAVDDLEFQINDYIEKNNINIINIIDSKIKNTGKDNTYVSNKKIELLFFHYVINLIYKLIFIFAIVIVLNKNLFNNNKLRMEVMLKSNKNVYLPIIQLLEQTTTKIFNLVISIISQIISKHEEFETILKFSHMYYWTCIKYILVIIEIENKFNENILKQDDFELSISENKRINIIEKGCIELRILLHCYYKELFDNTIFSNIWVKLSYAIENEKWERKNLNKEYKNTFQLFINGELCSKDSIGISDYFIVYNGTEYTLPLCCLQSIKYTNILLGYIKRNPIIFYYGIIKVLQFVLNCNIKCYNIVINGEKNNYINNSTFKVTIYSIILCIQNIYFWLNCLEKIIKYQLETLSSKSFILDKVLNRKMNLIDSSGNLGILLGINMPSDHYININTELNNVILKLKTIGENSTKKISDIIVIKFRFCVIKWLEKNIQVNKHINNDFEFKNLVKNHIVDEDIELFIKDFTNITKTLNKNLKVDVNINLNIMNNINRECTNIWKSCLSSLNGKPLNFQSILLDMYCSFDKLDNATLVSSIITELYGLFNKQNKHSNSEYSNKILDLFQLLKEKII
ncbi:hypothetical protein RS030_142247 [Cryptosporidium xiaoi]|uniref:Vacuolar protein sorting-associated protein 54 C-terminal domain-containing protein n=1 Tax=Cryptosporidium xiaoi TaxID=659607 RepID=A0AAV9Y194_9CRYT